MPWEERPAETRLIEGDHNVPDEVAARLQPLDVWYDATTSGVGDRKMCAFVPELGWSTCVGAGGSGWLGRPVLVDPARPLELWTVPEEGISARERLLVIVDPETVRQAVEQSDPVVLRLTPTGRAIEDVDAAADRPAFTVDAISLADAEKQVPSEGTGTTVPEGEGP